MGLPTSVFLTPSRGFCAAYAVVFQTAPTHGIARIRLLLPYGWVGLFGPVTSLKGLFRIFQRTRRSGCRASVVVFNACPGQSPDLHSRPFPTVSSAAASPQDAVLPVAGPQCFSAWLELWTLSGVASTTVSWTF